MSIDLQNARKQEVRFRVLCALDQERPNYVPENILIRTLTEAHLPLGRDELRRELDYLKDKKLITLTLKEAWTAALLAPGVDLLEGNAEPPPGMAMPSRYQSEGEIHRRQEIRWRILRICDVSRPLPISETLAWRTLDDAQLLVTVAELRRAVTYLEQKGLLEINRKRNDWAFELTATGVEVVEYAIDCPPGIARPEKYW